MEGEAHRNWDLGAEPVGNLNAAPGAIQGRRIAAIIHRIAADRIGFWFIARGSATEGAMAYLWAVHLLAGLVTYSLASAIGVVIAFLVDSRTGGETF